MEGFAPTARTQVRRLPTRGVYDREQIYEILDEGYLCHVAFVIEGAPFLIPTTYARVDDALYVHGSAASRLMRMPADALDICVNVTLVDGFVLARSVFHHSMNYRSVVVMGRARVVSDEQEKRLALHAFTDHIAAGRWEEARQPNEQELKATGVLALAIAEASAKVRTGPPKDDEEDYELPVWAGVIPVQTEFGKATGDSRLKAGVAPFDIGRLLKKSQKRQATEGAL